jgi:hypothetical protein
MRFSRLAPPIGGEAPSPEVGRIRAAGDAGSFLSQRARLLLAGGCVAALLGLVAWVFWEQDVRYMLPTPRPPGLVQPGVGSALPAGQWLARLGVAPRGLPVHLHVFNPDCPCSRFNADHVRELARTYGDRVQFVGLIQVPEDTARADAAAAALALELGMPLAIDEGGAIARAAGVYSTPQAVLVDAAGGLVYRGNYNLSRYHVDRRTEHARLALEALVGEPAAFTDPGAPAYGCELPRAARAPTSLDPTENR